MACALVTSMSLISVAVAAAVSPVVGTAGGTPVTVEDLRRHGAASGDLRSVQRAVSEMREEVALAAEARSLLGAAAAQMTNPEAAQALIGHLFGPAICDRIPTPARKEHYAATRWRFMAPPAWYVEDLQLLCCEHARDCKRPEVRDCIASRAPEIADLWGRLENRPVQDGALKAEVERIRGLRRQAALHEYVFYHSPDSTAPIDGRLQTVDAPIAQAVSSTKPGSWIGPIATRFGHHILRLKQQRPEIHLPYEDPRTQALLITELCPAFLTDQRRRYTHELIRVQAWQPNPTTLHEAFHLEVEPAPP